MRGCWRKDKGIIKSIDPRKEKGLSILVCLVGLGYQAPVLRLSFLGGERSSRERRDWDDLSAVCWGSVLLRGSGLRRREGRETVSRSARRIIPRCREVLRVFVRRCRRARARGARGASGRVPCRGSRGELSWLFKREQLSPRTAETRTGKQSHDDDVGGGEARSQVGQAYTGRGSWPPDDRAQMRVYAMGRVWRCGMEGWNGPSAFSRGRVIRLCGCSARVRCCGCYVMCQCQRRASAACQCYPQPKSTAAAATQHGTPWLAWGAWVAAACLGRTIPDTYRLAMRGAAAGMAGVAGVMVGVARPAIVPSWPYTRFGNCQRTFLPW